VGPALGAGVFARYGWHAALLTGMAFPGLALLYWTMENFEQAAACHKPA
jgi:hypothetical protein